MDSISPRIVINKLVLPEPTGPAIANSSLLEISMFKFFSKGSWDSLTNKIKSFQIKYSVFKKFYVLPT